MMTLLKNDKSKLGEHTYRDREACDIQNKVSIE